ncbi:MAG: hypothetical protein GY720_22015, partial [bacterium]|nr:hypothetical protein [bacterium]
RNRWEYADGIVGETGDEGMSHSRWAMNPSAWIHRACEAWVGLDAADDPQEGYGFTQTFFDEQEGEPNLCTVGARGLPTSSQVYLVSRNLDGSMMARDSGVWLQQGVTEYNDQGLVTESWAGVDRGGAEAGQALQYSNREYDAQYGAAVVTESIQANRPGESAYPLDTHATWDTNLGALTSLTDFNEQMAFVVYDAVGRMLATYRPMCAEPSVVHEYNLD